MSDHHIQPTTMIGFVFDGERVDLPLFDAADQLMPLASQQDNPAWLDSVAQVVIGWGAPACSREQALQVWDAVFDDFNTAVEERKKKRGTPAGSPIGTDRMPATGTESSAEHGSPILNDATPNGDCASTESVM